MKNAKLLDGCYYPDCSDDHPDGEKFCSKHKSKPGKILGKTTSDENMVSLRQANDERTARKRHGVKPDKTLRLRDPDEPDPEENAAPVEGATAPAPESMSWIAKQMKDIGK